MVRDGTFQVMVGNGERINFPGRCLALTLVVQNHSINADFYVLPVASCQVVLGVQWLETLGPMKIDYKKLNMQFNHKGQPYTFQRLSRTSLKPLGNKELLQLTGMRYFL